MPGRLDIVVTIFLLTGVLGCITLPLSANEDMTENLEQLVRDLSSSKQGVVLKGGDSQVYISLGKKDGVVAGQIYEIMRQGEPLNLNGEIVGYEEQEIAKVRIDRVRGKLSIASILEKKATPIMGDIAYQLRKPVSKIAISQFSDNRIFNMLTQTLQDKLITIAINRGMQVTERSKLEEVLTEQKLGYSGLLNPDSAKKIGKLLGADAIMVGTISDLGENIDVNARIVDVETGDSLSAATTFFPNTPLFSGLRKQVILNSKRTMDGHGTPAEKKYASRSGNGGEKAKRNSADRPVFKNNIAKVEVLELVSEEDATTMKVKITNLTDRDGGWVLSGGEETYLISDTDQLNLESSTFDDFKKWSPYASRIEKLKFSGIMEEGVNYTLIARVGGGWGLNTFYVKIDNLIRKKD